MTAILSDKKDFFFISSVGLTSTMLACFLAWAFHLNEVTPLMWLFLVVGIDVAHVYSTLYRTFFSDRVHPKLKPLLILVPVVCFLTALALALISTSFFWTALVYIAVFHFVRQQIGFLRILSGTLDRKSFLHRFNEISVYIWTLGSILIWHLQGLKSFHWFTKNDFIYFPTFHFLVTPLKIFLGLSFVITLVSNWFAFKKNKISYQVPVLLLSTFISWFIPIALLDSDFIFTVANILSHGIPYMALVYSREKKLKSVFSRLEIFIALLLIFAFLEEALWDAVIWREHFSFFHSFYFLPSLPEGSILKAAALALLISPQLVHYILDGFIWKKKYSIEYGSKSIS